MPTLAPAPLLDTALAARIARENVERNLAALTASQGVVAELLAEIPLNTQWVYSRDGSLTAMQANGRWWADCSVPLLAGRALLQTLQAGSTGSCLLAPGYAGLVVAARERIDRCTPLFVVQPDVDIARMILACHDFSDDIARHRLWLVSGQEWDTQMRELFLRFPGLATPVQFIRTKLTPEILINSLIENSQAVFSKVLRDRSQQVAEMRNAPRTPLDVGNILIIGGTEFRLWDDGAQMLHEQVANATNGRPGSITRFDTDQPLTSSPIALLQATSACGSVVSANLCRPDCNNLVPLEIPWITWMTRAGAPPFESAGPSDGLILADATWREIAHRAGWPDDRIRVVPWHNSQRANRVDRGKKLLLLDNTRKIEIPASVKQFSSHRLLWDLIEEEISTNPFTVKKIDDYLTNRSEQLNIGQDVLDRKTFIAQLILPAYSQGLARILIAAKLPVMLWGEGWNDLEEFASVAHGPVPNRSTFNQATAQSTALVYCWPERAAHPIDATGKPIVHSTGNDAAQFVRNAQTALNQHISTGVVDNKLLASAILELLGKTTWV